MKSEKVWTALLLTFSLFTFAAQATEVSIDGFKYELDAEAKTATLTGYTWSPTKVQVDAVEWEGHKYAVTSVGNSTLCLSIPLPASW